MIQVPVAGVELELFGRFPPALKGLDVLNVCDALRLGRFGGHGGGIWIKANWGPDVD